MPEPSYMQYVADGPAASQAPSPTTATKRPAYADYLVNQDAPALVENRQAVTNKDRTTLQTLGLGPQSKIRWLRARGYDADLIDGDIAVKRKGAKSWGRIEPTGFLAGKGALGKFTELIKDLGPDALNEYASAIAMTKGAALGALKPSVKKLMGPVIGTGATLASAAAGGAAGAATAEAARTAAARAAGFTDEPGDLEARLKEEAALGAGGELLGRGLAAGGRFLKKELARPLQKLRLEREKLYALGRHDVTLGELESAQAALTPAKTRLGAARIVEKKAALAAKKADIEARDALLARFRAAEPEALAATAAGRQAYGVSENFVLTNIQRSIQQTPKGVSINWPAKVLRADFGLTAKAIERVPALGAVLRKNFGDNIAPIFAETGEKLGSMAMKTRNKYLEAFARDMGPDATAKAVTGFISDLAALLKSGQIPEVAATAGDNLALKQAASGLVTPKIAEEVMQYFSRSIRGRFGTEAQATTKMALEQANLGKRVADITLSEEKLLTEPFKESNVKALQALAKVRGRYRMFRAEGPTVSVLGSLARRYFGGGLVQKVVEPAEAHLMAGAGRGLESISAAASKIPGFSRLPPAQQAAVVSYLAAQGAER